jgi:uncharacterized protein (DUF362 family)
MNGMEDLSDCCHPERITTRRRVFLRRMLLSAGVIAAQPLLAACNQAGVSAPATFTPTPRAELPHIAVARGGDNPEALVQRALAVLGGIERFVKRGHDVIIKPNISIGYYSYQYASTTNPWVVGALVKLCLGAGARRVRVMDFPFGGSAEQAYARTGIQEQVIGAGGVMEIMTGLRFVKTEIPRALDMRSCTVFGDVLQADVLIDVPIVKQHSLAVMSAGMKNLMGVILERQAMHFNIGQRTADLASAVPVTLTVVDAVRALRHNGPTGGNLNDVQKLDTVIASADIVAADSYAATLLGLRPHDVPYITAATKMGLGRSDLGQMKIEEIRLE